MTEGAVAASAQTNPLQPLPPGTTMELMGELFEATRLAQHTWCGHTVHFPHFPFPPGAAQAAPAGSRFPSMPWCSLKLLHHPRLS